METCKEWKEAALREALEPGLKELEKRVKREILLPFFDKWRSLIGQDDEFEAETAEVFERLDCSVERTQRTRDGGYDIKIGIPRYIKSPLIVSGSVLVECKSQESPVGVKVIRELVGVMVRELADGGIVASLGGFTKEAEDEVLSINIMRLNVQFKPVPDEGEAQEVYEHTIKLQTLDLSGIVALDMESHGYSWIR